MKYAWYGSITSSSGALSYQSFRANSIFDPDQTGSGHQPSGHDQWAALYNNYVVVKSMMKVTIVPGFSQTVNAVCGTYLSPTTLLTSSTFEELIEQGKTSSRVVSPSTANPPQYCYLYFDAKREFNLKDVKDNVARIGAAMSATPSEESFFKIWSQSSDHSTTSIIGALAEITYTVLMSEPAEVPQS